VPIRTVSVLIVLLRIFQCCSCCSLNAGLHVKAMSACVCVRHHLHNQQLQMLQEQQQQQAGLLRELVQHHCKQQRHDGRMREAAVLHG
jgi:hypothetical protein